MQPLPYRATAEIIRHGWDGTTFWAQARPTVVPAGPNRPPRGIITLQKATATGCDVFHAVHHMESDDHGATWTDPIYHAGLDRRVDEEGRDVAMNDATPGWHAATSTLFLLGHNARYRNESLAHPYPRNVTYSTWDAGANTFTPWRTVDLPEMDEAFWNAGAGSAQWVECGNGELLVPIYFKAKGFTSQTPNRATVLRCAFDGETIRFLEHGDLLELDVPRGFCEPSLVRYGDHYYLTLRNDEQGYVARSADGLHFEAPVPWRFDTGEPLGNYNTQQHWIAHSDGLFLVYTRRAENNGHVFRHRAPLYLAQVDPETLCVLRETEAAVVPERGARLGNFGVVNASPTESWIVVAEWLHRGAQDVWGPRGADNALWLARIHWGRPNRLVTG